VTGSLPHLEPPRSDRVSGPPRYLLYSFLRPLARWLIRRRYDVRVSDPGNVPASGPIIYASNHVGVTDGPLLAIFAPRPAHALTKVEMFKGLLGTFLWHSGQIPLDRYHTDPRAVRTCLVSGAPVVPVTMIGTREPGGHSNSLPRRGAVIDMVFGEVWRTEPEPWPRTREQVEKASLFLREHMLVQLDRARASTGRELPGPLPPTDVDPDPATGVTDEGAP